MLGYSRCQISKIIWYHNRLLIGKTIYSTLDVVPHPITRIDLKKLKGFNKTELDDLKFAIVMNGIKNNSTLPKYLDELVSENNLDEEEQEILHTLFKEVYDYFNADWWFIRFSLVV